MPGLDESSSSSTWPTTSSDSSNGVSAPPYQWSLKTPHEEDQEYLSRLEAKLKQIQQPDPKIRDPKPIAVEPSDIDSDSDSTNGSIIGSGDERHTPPPVVDDDPGIHLLYEHQGDSYKPPSTPPSPPAHIVMMDPPDPADPTAIIPPDVNTELELEPEPQPESIPENEPPPARTRLVHFRSRVRIASTTHNVNHGSRSSSISESSSLSAPLRGPTEESVLNRGAAGRIFGVGPVSAAHAVGGGIHPGESLSEMMSSEAASLWLNRRRVNTRSNGRPARNGRGRRGSSEEGYTEPDEDADERTSLAKRPRAARYGATPQMSATLLAREIDVDAELDRARRAARKTEEDVIFGPWPRRLTNWNWWLYKIEHYTCGLCADDPYAE